MSHACWNDSQGMFCYYRDTIFSYYCFMLRWDLFTKATKGRFHCKPVMWSSSNFVFDFRTSAYEIYADFKSGSDEPSSRSQTHPSSDPKPSQARDSKLQSTAERFKNTFSRDVKVHFVGAWYVVHSWVTRDCTWASQGHGFINRHLQRQESSLHRFTRPYLPLSSCSRT